MLASSSHSVKLPTTTTPASDIATKSERLEQTRAPMTATMPKQLSLISHCPLCQPRAVSAALMPALPSCPRLRPLHCHATSIALLPVAHVPRLYRYTYMSVPILQYHTRVPYLQYLYCCLTWSICTRAASPVTPTEVPLMAEMEQAWSVKLPESTPTQHPAPVLLLHP